MVPLTRHGWRELLIGSVVLAVLGLGLGLTTTWLLGLIVLPALVFLFAFFRDPHRPVPTEQHAVVSPADGVVSDITQLAHDKDLDGPAVRIGIFLSVFNVHVNRSPCDGTVLSVTYMKGKFINAMRHNEASDENESNTIVLGDPQTGKPIAVVKQIVGLIARRIVCTARVGEVVRRGERIGMIKFGSRTELTLAGWLGPEVKVTVGQSVRGASDVVAVLRGGVHTTVPPAAVADEPEPLVGRVTPA
jgi:phosphatidylserine decarboxylase